MRLGPTMYFGELALLRGEPRAATVAALTDTSVLMLAREDFNILLGPLQLMLGQNAALYGPTAASPGVKPVSKAPCSVITCGDSAAMMCRLLNRQMQHLFC